jgi:hypothetical protein
MPCADVGMTFQYASLNLRLNLRLNVRSRPER